MTNPNQEPVDDELTLGQSLRLIAERTAFRTEDDSRKVLACLDKHIEAEGNNRDQANEDHDDESDARAAGTSETPTPADVPVQDSSAKSTTARGSKRT